MLIAEIRRKLVDLEDIDPEDFDVVGQIRAILRETKEDLLTSDVFGALKYLPRVPYLDAVLRAIVRRNPHCLTFEECVLESGPTRTLLEVGAGIFCRGIGRRPTSLTQRVDPLAQSQTKAKKELYYR